MILSFFGRPCTNVNKYEKFISQESKASFQKKASQLVWSRAVYCFSWCCASIPAGIQTAKENTRVALSPDTEERL